MESEDSLGYKRSVLKRRGEGRSRGSEEEEDGGAGGGEETGEARKWGQGALSQRVPARHGTRQCVRHR